MKALAGINANCLARRQFSDFKLPMCPCAHVLMCPCEFHNAKFQKSNGNNVIFFRITNIYFLIMQNEAKKKVLCCLMNGIPHRTSYPAPVRNFCMGLHSHSSRSYDYVREVFDKTLPHTSTIRHWYANSDIDAEHGVNEYSLNVLRKKVQEKGAKGEKLILALLFDEMSIKSLIQLSENGMIGYENFDGIDPKTAKPAKNAIVYMVSAVNDNFQIPVAYYFITTLNSAQKANAFVKVTRAIMSTNAILISATFDGIVTNPHMCERLGANLNVFSTDFKPYIEIDDHKIYIFFDSSHLLKLDRNTLGEKRVIYDADENAIQWKYIERLVRIKDDSNFSLTHKLNKTHLDWKNKIMKVRLAAETLSRSSADSIDFLTDIQHPLFKDAQYTAEFMRIFNDISDAFNSKRNKFKENPLKCPLSPENADQVFALFEKATEYILRLKIRPEKNSRLTNLCSSQSKTGFQGYIVGMKSLRAIYEKYVVVDKLLASIPTMSFSQDHLEIFFGRIRAMGRDSDNPTCIHFKSAYRRLMANTTLLYSRSGNVEATNSLTIYNPYSNISFISSRTKRFPNIENDVTPDDIDDLLKELANIEALEVTNKLTDLGNYSISHCANIIENRILTSHKFNCELCREVFNENKKLDVAFVSSKFKNRPCYDTHIICKAADHFMKLELLKGNINLNVLRSAILFSLDPQSLFSNSTFASHADHKLFLIQFIINEYVRIKGVYMARKTSMDLVQARVRQRLTKLIHFYNA